MKLKSLLMMAMSKSGIVGPRKADAYTDGAITVVEPGGRGYYLGQIGQVFHSTHPGRREPAVFSNPKLMTPDEWKKILFDE